MRRTTVLVPLLALLLLAAPISRAEDEAPKKEPMTPERVARLILVGGEAQQTFVAQYLEQADAKTLRAVQQAIRALAPKLAAEMEREAAPAPAATPSKGPVTAITIETRVLQWNGEGELLDDLGVENHPGTSPVFIDDTQKEVILRAVAKSERLDILTAPRVTVYDGQRANISMLNQVSYVQDYDVEVEQDTFIADPVIGVVQDGLTMDLRPTVSKDEKYVSIELDVTWADLKRPIAERKVILRDGAEPVTIQLPEIDVGGADANATLPTGGTMLVASPTVYGNGKQAKTRYVLVTATVVKLDDDR